MSALKYSLYFFIFLVMLNCDKKQNELSVEVYETSANGNKLKKITEFSSVKDAVSIKLIPEEKFQTITGFGGAFTESSAYLLNKLSKENR